MSDSLESPLEGLLDKPHSEMTEADWRAFVIRMNELRDSSQARQKYFRGTKDEVKEPKNDLFGEF